MMRRAPSTSVKSTFKGRGRTGVPSSGHAGLIRKTALLNLGIILSALVMGAYLGSRVGLLILLCIVPLISIVLWSATFAISAFVLLIRIFWGQASRLPRSFPRYPTAESGVGDEWLDGPY
jgi:hypothetical protein